MQKQQFILYEIWMLTVNASFQRANIYVPGTPEKDRQILREALKQHIMQTSKMYALPVNENQHLENIKSVITFSLPYKHMLQNASLSFGVSQKLLNLYLKYLWSLNIIPTPPHFPVDNIIQTALKIKNKPWTQKHFDEDAYMEVINEAAKQLGAKYKNIAEWELANFKRRINIAVGN